MTNEVIRDPSVRDQHLPRDRQQDCWIVVFGGQICSPTFNSKGAGAAYLRMLENGTRKPEYARGNEL